MKMIEIRKMKPADWDQVARIYRLGIETKKATFQTEIPTFKAWDKEHMKDCRLIAMDEAGQVVGWAALTPVSTRCVYQGVAEVSIYVDPGTKRRGVGSELLGHLIVKSEAHGIWTLQASIIASNKASIRLHEKSGFRLIGFREKIAKDMDGNWKNIVLMERRSKESRK